ncbi:MAG: acyl-CoA thioesterase II [Novosphingobium sp.]
MFDDPPLQQLTDDLVALLTVKPLGEDRFEGSRIPAGTGHGRVFGGQVIAQALAAAEATAPEDRLAHSLHAYFLRMGDDDQPIDYRVDRNLDGGSFSNRAVTASQAGRPILTLNASFHRREGGLSHQDAMPEVPGPEGLPTDVEERREYLHLLPEAYRKSLGSLRPIEQRTVERLHWAEPEKLPPRAHIWWRTPAPIPSDDPRIHRAVLAYASDLAMLRTATLPHGINWFSSKMQEASLDHAIWFHDEFRADEWLLFVTDSTWAGRSRAYITGRIFRRDGALVASITQEGMLRLL